jgi:hypothetical protein
MAFKAWVKGSCYARMALQEASRRLGVILVGFHTYGQRFYAA